jgi:hypothetical protein
MRPTSILWSAVAALGLALATPATAAIAAPAPYGNCSTSIVQSVASNLPIRTSANISAPVVDIVQRGDLLNCHQQSVILGGRYTACGVTQANGWVAVWYLNGDWMGWGYTYMTCVVNY